MVVAVVLGGRVVVVVEEVVVVVGGTVVVVVVVVGATVVLVVVGAARLSMSWEKPNAACRPAAAPTPGGSPVEATVASAGAAPVSSSLGEKAAKAAIASRAMTTQVAKARSLVNLTPVRFLKTRNPRCASIRGSYAG